MSNFKTPPRIVRGNPPAKPIKRRKHRDCLPELVRDFGGRCAYSMQHYLKGGGIKCLEVDHFDPAQKNDLIQRYENLNPATRHCNGAKRNRWPSKADQKLGIRFLNPSEESDYGSHIFEDSKTHKVFGITPAGIYQVRNCDLNAEHLVFERKERAEHWADFRSQQVSVKKGTPIETVLDAFQQLKKRVELMIPEITYRIPPVPL